MEVGLVGPSSGWDPCCWWTRARVAVEACGEKKMLGVKSGEGCSSGVVKLEVALVVCWSDLPLL